MGLLDRSTGLILTAKREGRLLLASARLDASGGVVITLPDGTETDCGEDIRTWLDRDVELVPAGREGGHFENPRDFEDETDWVEALVTLHDIVAEHLPFEESITNPVISTWTHWPL